eukprot:GHVP01054578.1.p1 GENE.GHVP01054578.1~~GHVP01054578.1.p1  ORF type:complete len:140 (+),score=18.02 GHVP01054578.1:90-509(+)
MASKSKMEFKLLSDQLSSACEDFSEISQAYFRRGPYDKMFGFPPSEVSKATNAKRARQKLNATKIHGFSLSSTDKKAYKNKLRKTQQKAKESIESAINHTRPTEKGLHSLFTRYLDYALEDRKSPLTTKNFRGPKGPRC